MSQDGAKNVANLGHNFEIFVNLDNLFTLVVQKTGRRWSLCVNKNPVAEAKLFTWMSGWGLVVHLYKKFQQCPVGGTAEGQISKCDFS